MKENNYSEQLQKQHYDTIASQYASHYGDIWSQNYRSKFINEPMLENINLSGAKTIDALCGSGETTDYLLKKGAQVTGIDISQVEMNHYQKRYPHCIGRCTSILSTGLESNFYDCVVVVGGLHHLYPNVIPAINEIYRILKVGGSFCFMEPHKGSLPDQIRQLWYKVDRLFAENEVAIDLTGIKKEFSSKFKFIKEEYKGNIAYLLVLNSLIFRLPLQAKPIYSPFLIDIESMIEKWQGKRFSCFVVCQWMKV
ncbi:MAG: class I SAM-dependent methyltransferase [Candidatus Magnetomorum sp.]|nr:class I SAM-dependent methyltransferase [Candidatus Magnetomorum sp.]